MNIFPNNNLLCPRPIAPPITPPSPAPVPTRRRLDGLTEGNIILVQTPSGICDQGVFIRIDDGFLIWVRTIGKNSFITITSLDGITISKI